MVHADDGVVSADGDDVGTLGMRMRKVSVRPRSDQDGMNVERRGDVGFLVLLMLTRGRADFSASSLTIAIRTAGGPTGGQCLNSPLTYLPPSLPPCCLRSSSSRLFQLQLRPVRVSAPGS